MKDYKVLFADLDGTLIETISGETFPKGVWDMRFNFFAKVLKLFELPNLIKVSNTLIIRVSQDISFLRAEC